MNAEQIRARLLEISAKLESFQAAAEAGTMSEDQTEEFEGLSTEFEELNTRLVALEKIEAVKARSAAPAARKTAPAAAPRITDVSAENARTGGFKSAGDFLMAVKNFGQRGTVAPQFQNVMYEKNGEDGGFLVPDEISQSILKKLETPNESLMEGVRKFPVSGNNLSMQVDETQPWNSGVIAYWVAEGAPIPESKPKFSEASLRLHKLAALVKATDELLDDAVALEGYIKAAAPEAIMYKANNAIISGDGVGKPTGLLNSGFTLTVAKEVGQLADSIVPENIIKMFSRMIPSALPGAKWYINAGAAEALNGMKNANGEYIYFGPGTGLNQSPYGVLMGRPVVPMLSGLPGLGDSGDIVFANLSYYWMIVKAGGVKSATSIHLHFDREITAFRFSLRLDGKVPFKTPVTTEFGGYQMSAFVKLADRA